jgi:hypothetical protein
MEIAPEKRFVMVLASAMFTMTASLCLGQGTIFTAGYVRNAVTDECYQSIPSVGQNQSLSSY